MWIVWLLLLMLVGAILAVSSLIFRFLPRLSANTLKEAGASAQIVVAMATTVGITMAAFLYAIEQQWSPHFEIDLKASVLPRPDTKPQIALLHVAVAITNEGRVAETVNGIEIAAVEVSANRVESPNRSGDLPGGNLNRFQSMVPTEIEAGETDMTYAELTVPCDSPLVRIIAKVPKPPYRADDPIGTRRVYERKLLVSLSEACALPSAPQSVRLGPAQ